MTPKAPPEIFLRNTDSNEEHKQGESAWSEIRVDESDVKYIRADLFPSPTDIPNLLTSLIFDGAHVYTSTKRMI